MEPGGARAAHRPHLSPRPDPPVDVYNLVSQASIEARIADLVGDKRALFTGLFDGTADEVAFSRAGSFVARLDRIVSASTASAPARETDPAPEPGIAADRAIDEVVEAADESMDATPAAHTSAATPTAPTTVPASSAAGPRPADVRDLLSRVSLVRQSDGGIRIEAPPESASTLAALFEGLADLLRRGATGSAPPP